ncbi:MAG: helix-turn-helix domain-containing protein [Treponema sp.]|jgi:transcriptional regulator with XRE-family HTH domain|nr:helix-turn-helix domain-containing protein [Treponema sp.]
MADKISEAEVRTILSRNLKRLRSMKNLSQLSLAVRAGLTHNFINDIENGKKWLSPKTLATLATVLDSKPHEFFAPEITLPDQAAIALELYLNNFADNVQRFVKDTKAGYLPKGVKED